MILGGGFLQWKDDASGCAGPSNGSWLCGDVAEGIPHMTEGHRLCGNDWGFQQDSAAVHNSCLTKNLFQRNNITFKASSPSSPDLNPIENILGWMASEVYKKCTPVPDSGCPS